MKKILKIISTVSIVLFGILWISSKFDFLTEYNSFDIRTFFVLIYLFSSLKYFQMEVKDKNAEIQELKLKLKKIKK
jgi:Gpi18-like mannosyltransferase